MKNSKHSPFAVSAGHQKTAEAAADVLRAGGNAVDAAIAAYWMTFIAEPCMASIGAGGFAMIDMNKEVRCLDFFCQTPIHKRSSSELEFYPITVDFGAAKEDFYVGKGAAATPGAVAGIFAMHAAYGTIPMRELVQPAVNAAKAGVALDVFQAYDFSLLEDIFAIDPSVAHIFFKDGTLKQEGDIIQMPQLADTIEVLAREGKDLLYRGEIAKQICDDGQSDGSVRREDMESYRVHWLHPLTFPWHDYNICTTPDPSMGGVILAALLLDQTDERPPIFSEDHFLHWADTTRINYERKKSLKSVYEHLLHEHQLSLSFIDSIGHKWSGTSHFNVVDKHGNAVALTTSIGEGNGYFIPGTEMQMNNMLGEAALLPNGYHSWYPNTRLKSMMMPTLVTDKQHRMRLSVGSGGAGRIPFAIAQLLSYRLLYELDLSEAVHAPRLFFDGDVIQVENGFDFTSSPFLINEWREPSLYFGGTHSIALDELGRMSAVADMRRHGYSITG